MMANKIKSRTLSLGAARLSLSRKEGSAGLDPTSPLVGEVAALAWRERGERSEDISDCGERRGFVRKTGGDRDQKPSPLPRRCAPFPLP